MKIKRATYLLLAAAALAFVSVMACMARNKKETFSLGDFFKKVKNFGQNVGEKVVNTGKNVGEKIVDSGKNVVGKIGDIIPGGGSKVEVRGKIFDANFVPVYKYRERASNGTWTCPRGTVDMGTNDDKQCLASEIGPRIFRNLGDGNWGWKCAEGTAPNPGANLWNQQCVRGWSQRRYINGKWRCYSTDTDTNADWSNTEWWGAHRQCLKGEYPSVTTRMWDGKGWSCPPGTDDTGLDWKDGKDGFKQCKVRPGG